MKEKKKEVTTEQKIYGVLLVVGLIALASLTLLYGRKASEKNEVAEQKIEMSDDSPVSGQVSTEEKKEEMAQEDKTKEEAKTQKSTSSKKQETASVKNTSYDGKEKLIWPVSGNVLIPYSMDTTVYFETLDQYQCNPALYIKAEAGTEVKSVYQGKVTQIQKDDRLGNLMTVDIGNGYQVTYGQLDEISLQEGDSVETGSVIGKVAEPTDYFLLEGSHLYFKMTKENEPVNPTDYFTV
jgi:septal ring factor EnvC (AmiA/AmiB activator)